MKTIAKILIAFSILSGASFAFAQDANTNAGTGIKVESGRAEIKLLPRIKAFLESKTDIRTEMKKEKAEKKEKKMEHRFAKMNERFEETVKRLEGIVTRVNSRIEKIKAAGGKTETAENFVAEAKANLDAARVGLVTLKTTADTYVSLEANASTTDKVRLRDSLAALKKAAKEVEMKLQSARNSLSKAIGSLKGVSTTIKGEINATTTVNY